MTIAAQAQKMYQAGGPARGPGRTTMHTRFSSPQIAGRHLDFATRYDSAFVQGP